MPKKPEFKIKNLQFTADQEVSFYKKMLLIRRFEEKVGQLYGMGLIGGFCHLYIGQEALVVGSLVATIEGDQSITSYRDHGHLLALDVNPDNIMAELMGKKNGVSKGKGGSMHMFSNEKHFYGGHGIVGAQVPLGVGIAFANKYKKNNNVCLVYYGDGAANQGQVAESYNMASLWNLPIIFIIENNKYAMGTSVERASAAMDFSQRGKPYDISGVEVNAMDVREVYNATSSALEYVRSGNGPLILDMETYRYRGHSMSDPANYRNKEEVSDMRNNRDSIENLKQNLLAKNILNELKCKKIEKEIKEIVNNAATFAQKDKEPEVSELYTDIVI